MHIENSHYNVKSNYMVMSREFFYFHINKWTYIIIIFKETFMPRKFSAYILYVYIYHNLD
jgi:hypothetical protein